jgi:enoyl-CoA hydratase/carnithine racemase
MNLGLIERLPASESILLEQRDASLVVTLNRPDRANALTELFMRDLRALWAAVAKEPAVRCVVLTGAGRA